jgi:cardiolipin synthase
MVQLKPIAKISGFLVLGFLALVGALSLTRGTPLGRVSYGARATAPEVSDSSFRDLMALYSGVHLEDGNRVEQLLNGDGTYPRLWADLRGARETITMQMYYAKPGQVADSIATILVDRARAGVRVLLLLDAFGAQSLKEDWKEQLSSSGVQVRTLRPLRWYSLHSATDRSHVRVVVVDGRIGYTGGFGIADYWLGDGRSKEEWRDSNVRFEGPAVMELQAAFAAAWVEVSGELLVDQKFFPRRTFISPVGSVTAGLLFTSAGTGSTAAERFLALSIAGARRTLYVSNSYFVPDDDFRELLTAAAKRGVDVRILTAGFTTDIPTTWYAGRSRYRALLTGGVRVYEYQPTMMHAKTIIADGIWGTIGSLNFDNRSLAFNNESNIVVWDRAFGALMDSTFLEDLALTREITLDQFERRPMTERLLELASTVLSRLL